MKQPILMQPKSKGSFFDDFPAAFLDSFPLCSATTGFRLYGRTPAPYNCEQIKAGDLAVKEQVAPWVGIARFSGS